MSSEAAALFYPKTCSVKFRCERCGHGADGVFHDPDAFGDREPIGGRSPWMQQAALEKAERELTEKAEKAVLLVRCPKCGGYSDRSIRRAYLRAAFPLCAVVPVTLPTLTMLIGAVLAVSRIQSALLALSVTSVVALLIVVVGQRRLVAEARDAVQLG